jgi:amino acid permease
VVVVSVAVAAMSGIYRTALYRFAVDGQAPPAFANADLGAAFGPRRGGRGLL